MIIRELAVEDVPRVRAVMLRTVREDLGDPYDPRIHSDIDDMESWYIDQAGPFLLVAVDGTEIVGTAGIRSGALKEGFSPPHLVERYRDGRTGQLVRVYVPAGHRRRGIARRLVNAVLDRARDEGHYDTIALHTYRHSPGAVAFWESFGAKVVEDDTDGVSRAVFMELG